MRWREFVLLIFIFLLPTQLGKHFFYDFSYLAGMRSDYLAPTLYLIDLIVLVLAVFYIQEIIQIFKSKKTWIIVCLLGVNILVALSWQVTLFRTVRIAELVVVYIATKNTVVDNKRLLLALLSTSALQFVLVVLQFVNKQSIQGIFYYLGERAMRLSTPDVAKASLNGVEILRPYGTFSHPNSMAGFFLLIYFFVMTNKRFEKYFILKLAILVITSLLVLFSFSKIVVLTYVLLNFIALYQRWAVKKCIPCTIARASALIVLAAIFTMSHGDPETVNKRVLLLQNAWKIFKEYPIFGVGIGNYVVAQLKYPNHYAYFFNQPVHNIFVLGICELGVLLGGYVLYLLGIFVKKNRTHAPLLYLVAGIVITGMFDHYWITLPQNWLLIPVLFAL